MIGRPWYWIPLAVGGLFALSLSWEHSSSRFHSPPAGAAQAQGVEPADTFRLVWAQPVPALRNASLSAHGQYIVMVGQEGQVSLWNWAERPERPLWSRLVEKADHVLVASGGKTVLAYARMDPTHPLLSILGSKGKLAGDSTVDGAIWDAAISSDGRLAGVTTGKDSLYRYHLGSHLLRNEQKISGIGNSVEFSPLTSHIIVGTWDQSGVACYTKGGRLLWQYPPTDSERIPLADRLFKAQSDQQGDDVLGLSYANAHDGDGTLYYWHGSKGRLTWQYPLGETALDPHALISQNGQCVAVTYTQKVTHGEQSVAEQRLMVLDAQGKLLWEKGGLLFSPTLVSIAADGHRITVSDGNDTLYHLDETGRITAPYTFHAAIQRTFHTADGHWLLVYTQDGMLNLLRID